MKLNKRGGAEESSLNWMIGAIIGILLAVSLVIVAIQWYQTTVKTQDSFDALIEKLPQLEDGEKNTTLFYLPEEYLLVSFSGGLDYKESGDCDDEVKIPDSCGTYPCICICNGNWVDDDDACEDKAVACHPFTEKNEQFAFTDYLCDGGGLYREGPSAGIFTLYYERSGSTIRFCSSTECVSEEHAEAAEEVSDIVQAYEECLEAESDCACTLNTAELFTGGKQYALNLHTDKITLYDTGASNTIYIEELETKIGLYATVENRENFPTEDSYYSLYQFTTPSTDTSIKDGVSVGDGTTYLVISPTVDNIVLEGTALTATQATVSDSLYKKDSAMYLVEPSFNFTDIPTCEEAEDLRAIFE
jgi:hypothetical protein